MKQWVIVILALAIAGATAGWLVETRTGGHASLQTGLLSTPSTTIGGPFRLIDQNSKTVTDKSWPGKYLLIYFGYTFCPDSCPTELLTISQALDQIGETKAAKVQPIFISIDPARDTPQKLSDYVPSFYPSLEGLTGSDADIAKVADEYKVYYQKSDASAQSTDYVMDHSTYVYLVNPAGQTIGIFSSDMTAEDMAKALDTAVP